MVSRNVKSTTDTQKPIIEWKLGVWKAHRLLTDGMFHTTRQNSQIFDDWPKAFNESDVKSQILFHTFDQKAKKGVEATFKK